MIAYFDHLRATAHQISPIELSKRSSKNQKSLPPHKSRPRPNLKEPKFKDSNSSTNIQTPPATLLSVSIATMIVKVLAITMDQQFMIEIKPIDKIIHVRS